MSLFVVEHRHPADRCPAQDPQAAPMLLAHLSADNARRHGLTLHGEAVIDGAHTLVMIVDGPDLASVQQFMQPFAQAGSVEVLPASACEDVVARGDCDPSPLRA